MLVTYGTRLYGKSDVIPNVGHVATKFWHASYIPILPIRGYFVFADGVSAVPIGLRAKSILAVYLRSLTVLVGFAVLSAGVLFPVSLNQRHIDPTIKYGTMAGCIALGALLVASTWLLRGIFERASDARRAALLDEIGQVEPPRGPGGRRAAA